MSLCRLVGAQPMICMNLGSGTKERARKWVEYVNGAPATPEGPQRRAATGIAIRIRRPSGNWGTSSGETTRWMADAHEQCRPLPGILPGGAQSKLSLARRWFLCGLDGADL